jgi:IS5 family transposase
LLINERYYTKELFELDNEPKKIDEFLDDECFMEPFVEHFKSSTGRPTVPVETYLRIMYRHGLGYETLVKLYTARKWFSLTFGSGITNVPFPS